MSAGSSLEGLRGCFGTESRLEFNPLPGLLAVKARA